MGLCVSDAAHLTPQERADKHDEHIRNLAIEKTNAQDHEHDIQIKKLLLLGAGESGKSTLFKQTVSLYGAGFTEKQTNDYVQIVHNTTVTAMQTLCREMDRLYETEQITECKLMPHNIPHQNFVMQFPYGAELSKGCAAAIKALWADPAIKLTFSLRSKFQLLDTADYFFLKKSTRFLILTTCPIRLIS